MTTALFTADPQTLDAARRSGDADYDSGRDLLLIDATPNPIHTRIVSGRAHRIRDSLAYVLTLLELAATGDETVGSERRADRAARVMEAVLDLQDTGPESDTYGLWAYWAEEPLSEMNPPDWNWADFMGEFLVLILRRHGADLDARLRVRAEAALSHAARSIIRRDVDLDYTNIAVKGTFVTIAAGEILKNAEFTAYGTARLARLHASLLRLGSFAEYNSPTYWQVVLQALTGLRQYVDDASLRPLAADIERVAWKHFLGHWHPATGQLSGPMARCYDTDLHLRPGVLSVLQKVAPETWSVLAGVDLAADIHLVHDAVLDYRIPDDLRPLLDDAAPGTIRETFADMFYIDGQVAGISEAGAAGIPSVVVPTVGATWREGGLSLGSVNFSDTWVQRRPLLGFWTEPGDDPTDITEPARFLSVEVVRDGHGFAGGSFRSVQQDGTVLWALSLATPSGDAHIHLDTIPAGVPVPTRELLVRFRISGLPATTAIRVDDAALAPGEVIDDVERVRIDTAGLHLDWRLASAVFDGTERRARVAFDNDLVIEIPWIARTDAEDLTISDLGPTFAAGIVRMSAAPVEEAGITASIEDQLLMLAGEGLSLTAPTLSGSRLDHARIALIDDHS